MHDWAGSFHDFETSFPPSGPTRVYDLAVRLEVGMSHHPAHPPYAFTLTKEHGDFPYGNGVTSVSEALAMGAHVGTHIDALGHIAHCGEIHGGEEIAGRHSLAGGLEIGSAEEIPPLLGPAHLLDAEALFGRELKIEDEIGSAELASWFDDHDPPRPGAVVLIRTGWMKYWDDVNKYIGIQVGLPGLNRDGAEWLSERGIVAAGSDTMNLEHKKAGVTCLEVHVHFLVEKGIYIMESLNLERLAADGVRDFTFAATPLRLKGASGSPIRPLAIVQRSALP
jgi:kynurenine formamidase